MGKIAAYNWHRSPVGFEEVMDALVLAIFVPIFQGEYAVGNDAKRYAMVRNLYVPLEVVVL